MESVSKKGGVIEALESQRNTVSPGVSTSVTISAGWAVLISEMKHIAQSSTTALETNILQQNAWH